MDHLVIEARGDGDKERLVDRVRTVLGGSLALESASSRDLAEVLKNRMPDYDPTLAPPELVADAAPVQFSTHVLPPGGEGEDAVETGARAVSELMRKWPDQEIPALGGLSPRQAVKSGSPEQRRILVSMVKEVIREHDERNLRDGTDEDINWLPRDLGLAELDQAPPPARPRPPKFEDPEGEEMEGDSSEEFFSRR